MLSYFIVTYNCHIFLKGYVNLMEEKILNFDYVIFDFDGTLADTGEGVFESIQYAVKENGYEPLTSAQLHTFIGPPLETSLKRECGIIGEEAKKIIKKYREYYSDIGIFKLRFFDSTISTLKLLHEKGVKIGVGSSKPQKFIEEILDNCKIYQYFDCISGASLAENHKNKIGIVNTALEKLGVTDKSRALMVGDRCFDVEGAHGCGIKCVCVLEGGYGSREEFEEAGTDFTVKTLADTIPLIIK